MNNLPSSVITYILDTDNVIDCNYINRRVLAAMPGTQKIASNAPESIYSDSQLCHGFSFHGSPRVSSLISIRKLKVIKKVLVAAEL